MGYQTRTKFDEYRRNNAGPMDPKLLSDGLEAAQSQVARLEHLNDRYSLKIRAMKQEYRARLGELEETVAELQASSPPRGAGVGGKEKKGPRSPRLGPTSPRQAAGGLKKMDKSRLGSKGLVTLPYYHIWTRNPRFYSLLQVS